MTIAPLTDEQLAAIRARHARTSASGEWRTVAQGATIADVGTLLAELDRLRAERDELLAELDGRDEKARKRWIKNQEKQLGIKYADFRAGRWEMDLAMGREMAAAYVAMAKTLLGDAPNYSESRLEFDVKIAESPELYTLVVQRHAPGALTPHEARQRAEAERDEALAEVERLGAAEVRLAELLRSGQHWRDGRLVSESRLSQHEIRTALGWPEPTDPATAPSV